MKTRLILPMLLAAALLAGCEAGAPAGAAGEAAGARRFGTLSLRPCTTGSDAARVEAFCGALEVPENRSAPEGRRIDLDIAVLTASGRGGAAEDPVFFLAGGPGQAATEVAPQIGHALREVRRQRDIVLVDQRGTGGSNPLDCRDADGATIELDGTELPDVESLVAFARRCAASLEGRADPRFYTTAEAVADLEAVREALGAERINLVGGSYGTRVAQQYAARHPERVRSIVIDGVAPNDLVIGGEFAHTFEDALRLQSQQCERLPACRERFVADMRAQLRTVMAQLEAAPVEVEYRDAATGESRRDTLTADTVTGLAFMFSYAPQTASLLPLVMDEADQGRYAPLMALTRMMGEQVGGQINRGMQWSVLCAEDADRYRAADAEAEDTLLGPEVAELFFAPCAVWPHGGRGEAFSAPLRGELPVLLLSGELDPVTPPAYAERVLQALPNGRHLVLRGQGHGTLGLGCVPKLLAQFIESTDAGALDAECLDSMTYVPPFTSFNGWDP
ncbi:alpha/beta fold hydrolase [Luteimonas sp. SJ-92]|uniref:Alpha/beta fold hydrolase n=1 Tax=Luteimonas salinisoli TaxID=2752307 RepID=A0A853J8F1_9GAMM|nr:alpha/beta hydrolase [Luteimonas salinisoli]NZA24987.1 alpha/beta fold hydrolase [Luteimonas salinisoli]